MSKEYSRTYGVEIEKPVSDANTGEMTGVSQEYFQHLARLSEQRGDDYHFHFSDIAPEVRLGVVSDTLGEQGLDNGLNLLETALPYTQDPNGLEVLHDLIMLDLSTVQRALATEGASLINFSIHPLGKTDQETYKAYVAPKGIYSYLRFRGWDHTVGIDAKAQNSPATGVSAEEAADAVSVVLGFGAVFVGLFANSPIAEGRFTGDKEHRLRIWEKMMRNSTSPGDRLTAELPDRRFRTLRDYFVWMFGQGTNMHFVIYQGGQDYKTGGGLAIIDGNPSVLEYLNEDRWEGAILGTEKRISISPELSHMEAMQFAQFAGARIRWKFTKEMVTPHIFLKAMRSDKVEEVFNQGTDFIYIEGRDPGANFPDQVILDAGDSIAKSVVVAPSAIQAGLINNLNAATSLLDQYPWEQLKALKKQAIVHGLDGEVDGLTVEQLADKVLDVAAQGLDPKEQWMLSYPQWVLETGRNAADRALEGLGENTDRDSIRNLVLKRKVILP